VSIAMPMVTVLARYALRFSVRAADLTPDFTVLWMGSGLALAAAVFLAFVPRQCRSYHREPPPDLSGNPAPRKRHR